VNILQLVAEILAKFGLSLRFNGQISSSFLSFSLNPLNEMIFLIYNLYVIIKTYDNLIYQNI